MDFKSLLQSMDAISETVHKGNYGNEYQPDQPRDDYGHKIPSAKKKEEPKKDVGGQSKADKFAGSTSGIQSMLGNKPKGKVGKVSAKRKLKDWIEVVEDSQLNEDSNERPYICVHAKKGKCEVKATSSYEAAKKAAAKWGLKGTSGIDSYVADVTHSASTLGEGNEITIAPANTGTQVIKQGDKTLGTVNNPQLASTIKQAIGQGQMTLNPEQEMTENGEKWIQGAIKHPGAFTKKAKTAHMGTQAFAKKHAHDSGTLGKQARLAQTLSKMHHEGVEETDNLDMPAHALDSMNEPNKKFYTNNPNAMRADRERVSTGANTLSDKGHERAGGAYKVRPSDPNKGKVTRLSGSFKNVKESVLNDSTGSTLQHILNTYKREVNDFKATGELNDMLYDALYDYYYDDMPYGTKKSRDGNPNPYEWIVDRFASYIGLEESVRPENIPAMQRKEQGSNFPVTMKQVQDNSDKISHADTLKTRFNQPSTANSPHPLAPNARRNAEIAKVTPQKTPWSKDPIAAATDRATGFLKTLRNPFKESTDMKDKQFESWEKQLNALLTEGLTVSSSTGQQGSPDSVSVTANDEDAQKLLSALRQAGIGVFGGEEKHGSPSAYGAPQHEEEPGHGTETPMSPEVVGDGDDMLALIKKMTGIESGSANHQPKGTVSSDYEDEDEDLNEFLDVQVKQAGQGGNATGGSGGGQAGVHGVSSGSNATGGTSGASNKNSSDVGVTSTAAAAAGQGTKAGNSLGEEEVSEGWDAKQAVKDSAKQYMQSTGMNNVHDLDAEAIEYIGNECQINYEEVCKILGCELPEELGPVDGESNQGMVENTHSGVPFKLNSNPKSVILQLKDMGLEPEVRQFMAWARDNNFLSVKDALDHATTVDWEEFEGEPGIDRIIDGWWRTQELLGYDGDDKEVEEGNAFTGAVAKAKSDNIPDKNQKFKVGNKEYPVKEEEEMCNECGMMECECDTEEQVEESFANSDDDKAFQDLQYMLQTLAGGMNGPKRSQATGNIQKVTMETTLMKDSTSLLTDWQKLSGIK